VTQPVLIVWGDQDHQAPPPVLDAYRDIDRKMSSVDVHIFPGVLHGYMMPGSVKAYDQKTRDFTMQKTLAMLESLKTQEAAAV